MYPAERSGAWADISRASCLEGGHTSKKPWRKPKGVDRCCRVLARSCQPGTQRARRALTRLSRSDPYRCRGTGKDDRRFIGEQRQCLLHGEDHALYVSGERGVDLLLG